jgi:hypothetical protein
MLSNTYFIYWEGKGRRTRENNRYVQEGKDIRVSSIEW